MSLGPPILCVIFLTCITFYEVLYVQYLLIFIIHLLKHSGQERAVTYRCTCVHSKQWSILWRWKFFSGQWKGFWKSLRVMSGTAWWLEMAFYAWKRWANLLESCRMMDNLKPLEIIYWKLLLKTQPQHSSWQDRVVSYFKHSKETAGKLSLRDQWIKPMSEIIVH